MHARHAAVARLTSLLAFIIALGSGAGCRPLQPSGGKPSLRETGQVRLSLSPGALLLLDEMPTSLRVRIFRVEGDQTGDQEGGDKVFPIAGDDGSYRVGGIRLGWKEFEVALLNAAGESLGEGRARHLVRPGAQALGEPIVITVRPPQLRRRDVELALFVRFTVPGEEPKTTYIDVKPILDDHCVSCHAAASRPEPGGGLILERVPFLSRTLPTQDEIVADMLRWMKDRDYPMPPPPAARVPADRIALVQKWLDDGLAPSPSGGDDTAPLAHALAITWRRQGSDETGELTLARADDPLRPYPGACRSLAIGARYDFEVKVMAESGAVTHVQRLEGMLIGEGGAVEATVDVPYEEPQVDIPVIVVRP